MAIFEASSYIKHFFTSKSLKGHGVHSPFVYELVTEVFLDRQEVTFTDIESLRKRLLNDQRTIVVRDLGAGSKKLASKERTIASIALHSAKGAKIGRLMHRLAKYLNPPQILELGTSLGLTTAYLAKTDIPIITVEGCENIAEEAQRNLSSLDLQAVKIKLGNFDDVLPEVIRTHPQCSFVFVDGNHTYEATVRYYQYLKKSLPATSAIVFDDIYWSSDMNRAWKEIVSDSDNHITIDLFHLGLVFFKPDQAKEHFSIRI